MTETDTGRLGVLGIACGSPLEVELEPSGALTDDRRPNFLKEGLEAVEVDILDLIVCP